MIQPAPNLINRALLIFFVFVNTATFSQQTTIKDVHGDVIKGNKIVNYNKEKTTIKSYSKPVLKPVLDVLRFENTPNPVLEIKTIDTPGKSSIDFLDVKVNVYNIGNAVAYNIAERGFMILEFKGKFQSIEMKKIVRANESTTVPLYPLSYIIPFSYGVTYKNVRAYADPQLTYYFYFSMKYSDEEGNYKNTLHKFFLMPMSMGINAMPETDSLKYQELKKFIISIGRW